MKYVSLLLILLSVPATAFAQVIPGKTLEFAQIAFGGGYETVLNLTNRGTSAFSGRLALFPTDSTKPFPAVVNGNPVSGGMNLALSAGATASLRITSGDASAGTLSGFARIVTTNQENASLLEGNLTYYVKSADGTIVDSVGVAPSTRILQAVIAFDDFQTVALALANHNGANQTATTKLTLLDDKNTQIGTATQALANDQQVPKFLYQFFPGVSLTKGRVEIQSDRPFFGTALTFVKGGQAASLPFLPAIKLYNLTLKGLGQTLTSQAYFTLESGYVTGYGVNTVNGVPQPDSIEQITGLVTNGNLELFAHTDRGTSTELVFYVLVPGFDPSGKSTQSGTAVLYFVNPPSVAAQGTVTLTAIN